MIPQLILKYIGKREAPWFGRNIGKVIFSEDHLLKKDLRAFNPKVHLERFEQVESNGSLC